MEKVHYLKRFMFLVMALGLVTTFVSCDDDDEPKPNSPALTDVVGDYTGKMQILLPTPAATEGEETPEGTDVAVKLTQDEVVFEKFPVADLITAIVGEEAAPGIIEAVGDVSYKMKYTPAFNDEKTAISLTFTPEPLVLEINFPTEETAEGEEGEETPDLKVEVTVVAPEAGTFAYAGDKLALKLQVSGVKVNGEPLELPTTTFSFNLAKTK
ncbi:DUF4840 domain-containing protein [Bacteroides oleiciplenus]|uniref:DUF4840 domain-containing protein n=1 Tax=Bacteroides oleiciplenus TaxID=626931 RepID=UPI0026DBF176|nr:DUF4840 domain-containing protein [Bacteroides oleiciplenus]